MSEDIVRVLRILEYVGPRSWVEKTLANSAVKGEKRLDDNTKITAVVLGEFPEIIQRGS